MCQNVNKLWILELLQKYKCDMEFMCVHFPLCLCDWRSDYITVLNLVFTGSCSHTHITMIFYAFFSFSVINLLKSASGLHSCTTTFYAKERILFCLLHYSAYCVYKNVVLWVYAYWQGHACKRVALLPVIMYIKDNATQYTIK